MSLGWLGYDPSVSLCVGCARGNHYIRRLACVEIIMKKTLDIHHTQKLNELKKVREEIAKLQDELNLVTKHIAEFVKQGASEAEFRDHIANIDRRIELEAKIKKLSPSSDETSYLVKTSDILFKYYNLVEKGGASQGPPPPPTPAKSDSILRFFTKQQTQPPPEAEKPEVVDRGSLLETYMSLTNEEYVRTMEQDTPLCKFCKSTDIVTMTNDGYTFCSHCHTMEQLIVDHDKPSYKDPPKEITYFSYKRINHLNEWLNQIQGKETTEIPEEIYDKILLEIKKQRITNMADLTTNKVKRILKQLKVHKYYEHIPHIINRLNGRPMPNFTPELEEKLRMLFKHIQAPFLKFSPNRKNFLSYSYCIHKSLQLLEKDEFLPYFPLLKSRDKLVTQDVIWSKICEEVGWQFIPSI